MPHPPRMLRSTKEVMKLLALQANKRFMKGEIRSVQHRNQKNSNIPSSAANHIYSQLIFY